MKKISKKATVVVAPAWHAEPGAREMRDVGRLYLRNLTQPGEIVKTLTVAINQGEWGAASAVCAHLAGSIAKARNLHDTIAARHGSDLAKEVV